MDWPNKPASIDLAVIFEFCDKNFSKCLKHGGLQIISSLFNVYSMSIQSLSKVYSMSIQSLFNVYPKSIQCQYLQISHGYHKGWPLPSQHSRASASSRLFFEGSPWKIPWRIRLVPVILMLTFWGYIDGIHVTIYMYIYIPFMDPFWVCKCLFQNWLVHVN